MDDTAFADAVIPVPLTDGIIIFRTEDGVKTNVPHKVVHHSLTGYEFGYGGSGPADLALNIAENLLTHLGFAGERMDCTQGQCFKKSWELHQHIKWHFIAPLDQTTGGTIDYQTISTWIRERM